MRELEEEKIVCINQEVYIAFSQTTTSPAGRSLVEQAVAENIRTKPLLVQDKNG